MTQGDPRQALARARSFVAARGDERSRRRLDVALGQAPREALGDVGWRPAEGVAGALAALSSLDLAGGRALPALLAWIEEAQVPDGSWSARPDAPEPERLVATGLLAGFLAKTSAARPRCLERAGVFLAARWGPERVQGGDFGAIAAYAHWFANAPHELSDAGLQWCGRELERGFRSGRLRGWQVARVLVLCDARALPGARLGAGEVVMALLAEQSPDGGWLCSEVDDRVRVAVSVDAAVGLARLGGAGTRG